MPSLGPAPEHLLAFSWYLPHQAWLKEFGHDHHDSEAEASRAYLTGANLTDADLTGADLTRADLTRACLSGADLTGANLTRACLRGADLTGACLRDADLTRADLTRACLRGACLRDVDVPVIEDIHKKVYESASQPDALYMGCWHHACGTTHCRAGWVVALAGEEGRKLEEKCGTAAAANLIYLKSDPSIDRMPDFYCTNEEALEDMKRLAGV